MLDKSRDKAFAAMRTRQWDKRSKEYQVRLTRSGLIRKRYGDTNDKPGSREWNAAAALDRIREDHERTLYDWQFPIRMTSMFQLIEQYADRGGWRRVAPAPRA